MPNVEEIIEAAQRKDKTIFDNNEAKDNVVSKAEENKKNFHLAVEKLAMQADEESWHFIVEHENHKDCFSSAIRGLAHSNNHERVQYYLDLANQPHSPRALVTGNNFVAKHFNGHPFAPAHAALAGYAMAGNVDKVCELLKTYKVLPDPALHVFIKKFQFDKMYEVLEALAEQGCEHFEQVVDGTMLYLSQHQANEEIEKLRNWLPKCWSHLDMKQASIPSGYQIK